MNTTDTAVDTTRADTADTVSDTVPDTATMTRHDRVRWPRRWPLAMLAAPAGVATWSGWVGLGGLTGFGKVHPLPGIWDGLTVNSAITLPVGVEAYAAFALSAWLTNAPLSKATKGYAKVSAIAALVLGMLGQIAYHLLQVAHEAKVSAFAERHHVTVQQAATAIPESAPWLITTLVACLPVLVLGAGAGLAHMLHRDRAAVSDTVVDTTRNTAPDTVPTVSEPAPGTVSDTPRNRVEDTTRYVSSTVSKPVSETVSDTAPARVENTMPDTTADTVPPVSDTAQNTPTDTTPDTEDVNEYVRRMADQERARKREEDQNQRQRKPAKHRGKPVDRNELARQIYDEHMTEHGTPPAVAELMRQLKAAGHPTGNKTAAALLNGMREHPLRLAQ
ncbi:hypothetical protein NE236_41635 [Actinoallomurus purpureus]|uniref:hypothetical protein n=1 Tax=Actinoallomurus purpureus TaxID=478114 RepID=UPI002091F067|nr:hypothetical protein [Actinoallomurus purpureus]MCO6011472.1 hypothetical protein [Actinoallomurus purpureus]